MPSVLARAITSAARGIATAALAAAVAPAALAQAYPTKPVHIIVPFPPGGSTDVLARQLGNKLGAKWGQTVIVENRAGAGGTLGADYVAKSAPDGYTLLMGVAGSNAIANALYRNLPYDVYKSFTPISMVVSAPLVLVKNPAVPAANLKQLVELAKAKPNAVKFGSPGNGTSMHLTGEMFDLTAGISMLHVAYRGSSPALTDLLGGQIDIMFGDMLVVMPQIESGKLVPLAVTSRQRHPLLPNVPTVAESGYPGFESLSWQGLFGPANMPAAIVEQLNREVNEALKSPDIKNYFAERGFEVGGSSARSFRDFVGQEATKWTGIIKTSGVVVE